MRVASWSGRIACDVVRTTSGCSASRSAPSAARSSREITQSPSDAPSKVMTFVTWGSSERCAVSLATCSSSSAKTTRLSESPRM